MNIHLSKTLLPSLVILGLSVNTVQGQTDTKDKFLDTIRLGVRYQVQEFHTLNQKLKDKENCNCDESLPLNGRALQAISASVYEPLTNRWSVGADLGGSFGTVMDDNRQYKKYNFVQMRVESFYHLFDSKTKLRPYVSGAMQLVVNDRRGFFSLPLGAGLRYQLNRGASLHVQTAYDRGFARGMAKNMITNVGFNVPFFRSKSNKLKGSDLYPTNTTNSASVQWASAAKSGSNTGSNANTGAAASSQSGMGANATAGLGSATPAANQATQMASTAPKQLVRVIYFDTDRNLLNKAETARIMAEVLAFMAENKDAKVYLSGHTDNVQTAAYNMALSKSRVESTAGKLIQQGITADRISKAHYGESSPVASNKYESGRAANRRVEIVVR